MYYVLLILTALFWSGNFIIARGIYLDIPPVALTFWRWLLALLLLIPFSYHHLKTSYAKIRRNLIILVCLSSLSIVSFPVCIYQALSRETVINTTLVNSMSPIFIVIISLLGFGGTIRLRQVIGIAISMTGMFYIISKGNPSILIEVQFGQGDLLVLTAAIGWALYSNLLRHYMLELHPLGLLTALIAIGVVITMPFYVWEIMSGRVMHLTPITTLSIVYIAIFPSILAYLFWNIAVRHVGANKAGIFIHLIPVFSILMAILFLGETIRKFHLIGAVLIFLGIYLTTAAKISVTNK